MSDYEYCNAWPCDAGKDCLCWKHSLEVERDRYKAALVMACQDAGLHVDNYLLAVDREALEQPE